MNALDLSYCMNAADTRDPFRGIDWYDTFLDTAYGIGYKIVDGEACHCHDARNHDPDCGMVKRRESNRRVWTWDDIPVAEGESPIDLDGMTEPSPLQRQWIYFPRRKSYDDPDGWHRHQCEDCDFVWSHRTPTIDEIIPGFHRCPRCGGEASGGLLGYAQFKGESQPQYYDIREPAEVLAECERRGQSRVGEIRSIVREITNGIYEILGNNPVNPAGSTSEEEL